MPRRPLRAISAGFSVPEELNGQNNHTKQKDKKTDPVNAMHIPDPFILWPVGVFFAEIEVFGYLSEDAHTAKLDNCLTDYSINNQLAVLLFGPSEKIIQHKSKGDSQKIAEQIKF
jgi:hypothetical protein